MLVYRIGVYHGSWKSWFPKRSRYLLQGFPHEIHSLEEKMRDGGSCYDFRNKKIVNRFPPSKKTYHPWDDCIFAYIYGWFLWDQFVGKYTIVLWLVWETIGFPQLNSSFSSRRRRPQPREIRYQVRLVFVCAIFRWVSFLSIKSISMMLYKGFSPPSTVSKARFLQMS